mmetsp:Transcript_178279/g.571502  ORF Transcript_178279/g.571502 Transcript_178279/m.571502 type:complete len:252 (-) Transcript_178279:1757-2512(-)
MLTMVSSRSFKGAGSATEDFIASPMCGPEIPAKGDATVSMVAVVFSNSFKGGGGSLSGERAEHSIAEPSGVMDAESFIGATSKSAFKVSSTGLCSTAFGSAGVSASGMTGWAGAANSESTDEFSLPNESEVSCPPAPASLRLPGDSSNSPGGKPNCTLGGACCVHESCWVFEVDLRLFVFPRAGGGNDGATGADDTADEAGMALASGVIELNNGEDCTEHADASTGVSMPKLGRLSSLSVVIVFIANESNC